MTAPLIGPDPSQWAIQRCCRAIPVGIARSVNSILEYGGVGNTESYVQQPFHPALEAHGAARCAQSSVRCVVIGLIPNRRSGDRGS